MEDEVLALAKSLGQIGEKEAQVLGTLCGEACRTLDRRLLPGVTAEDCADAYKLAAAWLVLAALEESRGGVRRRKDAGKPGVGADAALRPGR